MRSDTDSREITAAPAEADLDYELHDTILRLLTYPVDGVRVG
jgi:hypothetical protein